MSRKKKLGGPGRQAEDPRSPEQHPSRRGLVVLVLMLVVVLVVGVGQAQTRSLEDRTPYDIVILKNKERHNVEPLPFKTRAMPTKRPRGKLSLRVIEDPDEEYEVNWAEIDQIVFYEDILLSEAMDLIDKATGPGGDASKADPTKFDDAYDHFAFMLRKYPESRGLQQAIDQYLFLNSGHLYKTGRNFEALAVLRELYSRNPKYELSPGATVLVAANLAASKIATKYIDDKNYEKAQEFILELRKAFPNENMGAANEAIAKLDQMASALRDESRSLLMSGKPRDAHRVSRAMLKIWPEVGGGAKLISDIDASYPLFYVGVTQKATFSDRNRIDNWPARRTGYLTGRNIMEFRGSGPEFGKYTCPLGIALQSYDRRTLTLELNPKKQGLPVTGHDMVKHFLRLSDTKSKMYNSAWAALMESVDVEEVYRVNLHFRRPNVRPESLLQIDISETFRSFVAAKAVGPFVMANDKPDPKAEFDEVSFVANKASPFRKAVIPGVTPPAEIRERIYKDSASAVAALKRGEVDVVDYVLPSEVPALQRNSSVVVVPYALPTVHMLIPNYEKPYTKSVMFRRSLVYGLRRKAIIEELLLRKFEIPGCQVVSGPFSISMSEIDPSGYAYDEGLDPRTFDPRTALTLVKLTEQRTKQIAEKKGEKPPVFTEMILAHPDDEVSRIICEAIAFQWNAIPDTKIKCVLKQLPPGKTFDPKREYDFLYARVAMWEPLRDARRLLAAQGLAGVTDDHVNRALQTLDHAMSERQLRERMQDLHRITHQSVTVVPLWQTVDYFAHRRGMRRRIKSPLSLYQDVLSWQMRPGGIESVTTR